MAEPTIETRLLKRFIVMTTDKSMIHELNRLIHEPWKMHIETDLDNIGDWNDVLLYRFLLLDLDEIEVFDPLDIIRLIRMQFQINLPVFCFNGDEAMQQEMRLSRADRFFSRQQMLDMLPKFFAQYT